MKHNRTADHRILEIDVERGHVVIMSHTIFETDGPLAILTFNRPEARNAMTWEMYEGLVEA